MDKAERNSIGNRMIGAGIGLVLLGALLIFTSHLAKKQHEANVLYEINTTRMLMEAGYAKGQMDAIKGIVHIRPINDSSCVWLSSPWGTLKPINDTITINIKYR